MTSNDPCHLHQSPPTHMLAIEGLLGGHQFLVKLGKRQLCREDRMLNVIKPVVAAHHSPTLANPALGPGIGRVDADVHDFGQLEAPFADDAEALTVPFGVGDQIDQNVNPERAREIPMPRNCCQVSPACSPSPSIASIPRNMYSRPRLFQNRKTSLCRRRTSP